MSNQRFSKQSLADMIWGRHREIMAARKFDLDNGTAQLRQDDVDCAVDYGALRELERIAERFELPGHSDGYMVVVR